MAPEGLLQTRFNWRTPMADPQNITEVLEKVEDKVDSEWLSLGQLVDTFGNRGFGPLLLTAAIIIVLPSGGIPGLPTAIGVTIILLAGQMVFGRSSPWLPKRLRKLKIKKQMFDKGVDKIRPVTQKIDYVIKPRLKYLANGIAARLVALVCLLLAGLLPFTEVIPFSDIIPGSALGLLGLGLTARDGVVIILGLIVAVAAVGFIGYWIF